MQTRQPKPIATSIPLKNRSDSLYPSLNGNPAARPSPSGLQSPISIPISSASNRSCPPPTPPQLKAAVWDTATYWAPEHQPAEQFADIVPEWTKICDRFQGLRPTPSPSKYPSPPPPPAPCPVQL